MRVCNAGQICHMSTEQLAGKFNVKGHVALHTGDWQTL